jgi:hypothetical protein
MLICFGKKQNIRCSCWKSFSQKLISQMLMEHFLCDDVGWKRNMCGIELFCIFEYYIIYAN